MKKFSTIIAVTALTLGLGAPILAQAATDNMKDAMTADHSMRSSMLIGAPIYNDNGDKIGSVIEILVRGGATEPLAIVSVGDYIGGGAKLVAFPVSKLELDAQKARMKGADRRALEAMPAYSFQFAGGNG